MTLSVTQSAITEDTVLELVHDWFAALNGQVPTEELLRLLVPDGLVLRFPDVTLRGHEDVHRWWTVARRQPAALFVAQDVGVRILSPLHAEVTLTSMRGVQAATETWSVVARDGAVRIRTCVVHTYRERR